MGGAAPPAGLSRVVILKPKPSGPVSNIEIDHTSEEQDSEVKYLSVADSNQNVIHTSN